MFSFNSKESTSAIFHQNAARMPKTAFLQTKEIRESINLLSWTVDMTLPNPLASGWTLASWELKENIVKRGL